MWDHGRDHYRCVSKLVCMMSWQHDLEVLKHSMSVKKENTFGTSMNFNAKEMMEETQIFNGEFTSQLGDKPMNPI